MSSSPPPPVTDPSPPYPSPPASPPPPKPLSSDGSLASFALSSYISSSATQTAPQPNAAALVDPVCIVQAHSGPAYDVKFYPDWQQPLLFSCGGDDRIRGWRWHEMQSCLVPLSLQGDHLEPVLDLVNPQHDFVEVLGVLAL